MTIKWNVDKRGICGVDNSCKLWQNDCCEYIALYGRESVYTNCCGNCRHWTETAVRNNI